MSSRRRKLKIGGKKHTTIVSGLSHLFVLSLCCFVRLTARNKFLKQEARSEDPAPHHASSTYTQCCWWRWWWRLLLIIISPSVCCSGGAACSGSVTQPRRGGMHYCQHKKGFIITLALSPLTFLLIFSTARATRSILFHFLIPLVTLHLVCPRSFWCNPTTIYSGISRDFGAFPKMLGCIFSALVF